MKTLSLALITLTFGLQAFADTNYRIPRTHCADSANMNVDGTVTIKNPKLVRGRYQYRFGFNNDLHSVCASMGFEEALPQSKFSSYEGTQPRAYMNSDGTFRALEEIESYSISEITCLNSKHSPVIKMEDYIENADNSVTVVRPRLQWGNRSYLIGNSSSAQGLCKAMGLGDYLPQTKFTSYEGTTSRSYLRPDGSVEGLKETESYSVSEITCADHRYATVVVDAQGNQYIKRR